MEEIEEKVILEQGRKNWVYFQEQYPNDEIKQFLLKSIADLKLKVETLLLMIINLSVTKKSQDDNEQYRIKLAIFAPDNKEVGDNIPFAVTMECRNMKTGKCMEEIPAYVKSTCHLIFPNDVTGSRDKYLNHLNDLFFIKEGKEEYHIYDEIDASYKIS
ncbi:hypothetical protein ACPF04_05580 [Campylobacter sp. MOP51]|uniref:hypothetical protein n=1 Tax=Campylobacter canis TaxID=3378588 RepID=UPI003C6A02DE